MLSSENPQSNEDNFCKTASLSFNSVSDAGVAALTANTGLKGASLNVMINLKFIKDDDFVKKIAEEVTDLTRKSSELNNEIMGIITQKI